jgi:hypothetical protein
LSINNPYLSINNPYLSINNPYLSINNPHNNSCEKSTQTNENEPNNNKPNNNKPNNNKPNNNKPNNNKPNNNKPNNNNKPSNLIPIPSIPDFHDDNTKSLKNNFAEIKIIYDEMINGLDILCDFTNPEEEKIKKKYMELNEKLFNLV